MYEALISHLRECAKYDRSENTFSEAADAIEALSAKVPQWIPVEERLPKLPDKDFCDITVIACYEISPGVFNTSQMIYDRVMRKKKGVLTRTERWLWPRFAVCNHKITHWMPKPEPPARDALKEMEGQA